MVFTGEEGILLKRRLEEITPPTVREGERAAGKEDGGFIEKFCVDFTTKAKSGEIDPVFQAIADS